ncbi:methylated-DNA--[protein]-cysteine S-methyltransferase [Maridesulfovibrio bastinii]|uniref:methylated-DNA--[protein]-cysteine S-methyltransferase n=1 Tax=Maridesulfovibrio bastinii TaxID=47157 RepID=UPI00041C1D2D|nr:methylated-DNA--[protein]-cysteine S-methyltransferase [Maridesulfovibrio bastinii]
MDRILQAASGRIFLRITLKNEKVTSINLDWNNDSHVISMNPETEKIQKALDDYTSGKKVSWPEFEFDFSGLSEFRKKVLQTLYREVGWGSSISYGGLAALAGSPRAARAVGGAMAANPFPLIIPCHRVLGSDRSLTGFSGTGIEMKKYLLHLEGIGCK